VLRLNHVGDWGTQFGMLIYYLKKNYPDALKKTMDRSTTTAISSSPSSSSSSSLSSGIDDDGSVINSVGGDGIEIGDLVEFYKAAKKCFDEDEGFKEASRLEVVQLQSGGLVIVG